MELEVHTAENVNAYVVLKNMTFNYVRLCPNAIASQCLCFSTSSYRGSSVQNERRNLTLKRFSKDWKFLLQTFHCWWLLMTSYNLKWRHATCCLLVNTIFLVPPKSWRPSCSKLHWFAAWCNWWGKIRNRSKIGFSWSWLFGQKTGKTLG